MKRSRLDSLVTEKTLRIINGADNANLVDLVSNDADNAPHLPTISKNVCAKVASHLSDEIDSICGFLNISKRVFIEAALIQAVQQAEEIMEKEGLYDHLADESVTYGKQQ